MMRGQRGFRFLQPIPALALLGLALLAGCITQSVQPLYSDDTVVFDERLVGSWVDDQATWSFSPDGAGGYRLLHGDDEGSIVGEAHLARIGDGLFLDIQVRELPEGSHELYSVLQLPLHALFRVDEIGDSLRTSVLAPRWLDDFLAANPDAIAHTYVDERAVFTGDTEALQRFLGAHAGDPQAWDEALVMRRSPSSPGAR